jgi:hypothetical protein
MARVGVAVVLGLQSLSAAAVRADAPASCPPFGPLREKLDRRIAGLKPGVPLQEFTQGFASQALHFETPTAYGGALFIVGMAEGNATATDTLRCRFDSANKLISCHRECCAYTIREVTLDQFKSVAVGDTRAAVEQRLCSPSTTEKRGAAGIATRYYIDLPVGHHDEGQTVMLVYERGRLVSKSMSPY